MKKWSPKMQFCVSLPTNFIFLSIDLIIVPTMHTIAHLSIVAYILCIVINVIMVQWDNVSL